MEGEATLTVSITITIMIKIKFRRFWAMGMKLGGYENPHSVICQPVEVAH